MTVAFNHLLPVEFHVHHIPSEWYYLSIRVDDTRIYTTYDKPQYNFLR